MVASHQQGEVMAPQLADHVNQIEEESGCLLALLSRDAAASPHLCPPRLPLPFLQLLSSHVATLAKAVQCDSRLLAGLCEHVRTIELLFLTPPASSRHHAALAAVAPLVVALLMPRCAAIRAAAFASCYGASVTQLPASNILRSIAAVCSKLPPRLSLFVLSSCHMSTLVFRAVEEVRNPPQRAEHPAIHRALLILAIYARLLTSLIQRLSKEGCEGAAAGTPELRYLLAGPLLQLLGSPLLDLLVHTPDVWDEEAVLTRCHYRLNCLTLLRLPDTGDSQTMAQVRHTLKSIN